MKGLWEIEPLGFLGQCRALVFGFLIRLGFLDQI